MIKVESICKRGSLMSTTYTESLEREIWNMAEELDENEDFSKVIDFLNSEEGFQPFGKRLAAFIAKTLQLNATDFKTIKDALKKQRETTGVDISEIASDGTLRNWFDKGTSRKKGDDTRQHMFALAFALRLSVDDTKKLFHKIFLDRAFNYRNEKEVIYYFCLKNNKSWADAKRMIAEVENMAIETSNHTQLTNVIAINVDTMSDEKVLLEYIRENGHNFEKNSVMAQRTLSCYLEQAKKYAKEEVEKIRVNEDDYDIDDNGNKIKLKKSFSGKCVNKVSDDLLYEIITGKEARGEKTVFKNAILPKEIKKRFPIAATFSKAKKTSEEYRKVLILLFSFDFWYKIQNRQESYGLDDYTEDLNNILSNCNYPELYYGNPFDWLFLFCTQAEQPLDLFRELLAEVFA